MPVSGLAVRRRGAYKGKRRVYKKSPSTQMALMSRVAKKEARAAIARTREHFYRITTLTNSLAQYNTSVPVYMDTMEQIPQGDGISSLSGHQVFGKSLKIKMIYDMESAAEPCVMRALVLINKEGQGNVNYRTGTSIFDVNNNDQSMGTYTGPMDCIARINYDLYTPLIDDVWTATHSTGNPLNNGVKEWYIPLNYRKFHFKSNSASPVTDQLIFLFFCRRTYGTDITSQGVTINAHAEFCYSEA